MKISPRKNSGMALIVAMIAVTVLSILAAAFAFSMKTETKLAQNADSEVDLLWIGRSGVEKARWILSQESSIAGQPYDSLNQFWNTGRASLTESNSLLAGESLHHDFENGTSFDLKIIDCERFMNINTVNGQMIQQVLTVMGVDADQISSVSDAILDWIDNDDEPKLAGAESDYYQSLAVPYYSKNAPIDDLSELLLIKGITPGMFFGGSASNHAPSQFQHKLGLGHSPNEEITYPFGLRDVFTPLSSGQININTADTNVLQMIPGVDAQMAADIVQQRNGPDGIEATDDDLPFRNVNQLTQIVGGSAGRNSLGQFCTTRSRVFEVHVTAHSGDYNREYIATLFRNSGTDIRVLNFYWK